MKKVSDNFEITVTSVRRYLDMLQKDGVIRRDEKRSCGFILKSKTQKFKFENHNLNHIGIRVIMRVSNNTKMTTKDLFDEYCDDDFHFCKTRIPVREINPMAFPVSRSEARRMLERLDQFSDVTLDFKGVEEMGQGFAHEVFVVFKERYPEILIHVENANPMVQKMILHVQKNSYLST